VKGEANIEREDGEFGRMRELGSGGDGWGGGGWLRVAGIDLCSMSHRKVISGRTDNTLKYVCTVLSTKYGIRLFLPYLLNISSVYVQCYQLTIKPAYALVLKFTCRISTHCRYLLYIELIALPYTVKKAMSETAKFRLIQKLSQNQTTCGLDFSESHGS
jgi:hypothetical protein